MHSISISCLIILIILFVYNVVGGKSSIVAVPVLSYLPEDLQNTLQQVINHHDTLYKYQLSYHLKQLAEQHFRSGPGGRVDLGSFNLSIRPIGSVVTETVTASIGVVSSLEDILSTTLKLSSGAEVQISQFTGGRDNVTLKSRQWHIFNLLHERFGDNSCLPSIVSLSHLSNASIFTDDAVVSIFYELLIDAETPVTTAAIKAAAIRIRQEGASTSGTGTVDVPDDHDEQLVQLMQLQQQHIADQQQHIADQQQHIADQQEIQNLRQQLAILQLQMIPEVPTGSRENHVLQQRSRRGRRAKSILTGNL
jgi:hypothetical protein